MVVLKCEVFTFKSFFQRVFLVAACWIDFEAALDFEGAVVVFQLFSGLEDISFE